MEEYKNYIDGKWVRAKKGKTFIDINPANTEDIIGVFPRSDHEDVNEAVEAARRAFPKWMAVTAPKRAELIFKVGEILAKRKEELAKLLTGEMGKILEEARGDIQEAIDMAFYAAGEGRRLLGETTPSELPHKMAFTLRQPVGVVGCITPWNFPIAILSWKIFPALVCGNAVILKPAEDTPLMAGKFFEVMIEAGIPSGVINLVHGFGPEAGEPLVRHPNVNLISFTGSVEVGRHIAGICGGELKRLSLEMGGKNAMIVMDDCNLDLAMEGAIWGAFGTSGQRCTATSRIICQKGILEEFTQRFLDRTKRLVVGNGLHPDTDLGPIINREQLEKIHQYTKIGKEEGATLLWGGEILKNGPHSKGYFYSPTIFTDVKPSMRIAQEEIFGPSVGIIPVSSLEEAIEVSNAVEYGLSSSIYTRDIQRAMEAVEHLITGITYINAPTIGAEVHLPFGGRKNTGNGHREAGTTVLDIFTEWKTVYLDYSGRLQRAQIDI